MRLHRALILASFCAPVLIGCPGPALPGDTGNFPPSDAGPGDTGSSPSDAGTDAGTDAGIDAGIDTPPPVPSDPDLEACWPGRFCWLEGAEVTWIDGADDASVHVVDQSGRVFRRDGDAWTELPGIVERRVSRIYVVGRDDVWALAEHRDEAGWFLDHFDGSAWSTSWPQVDGTYLGGFEDEVWTRVEGRFVRHDESGWHFVPEIDSRFRELATQYHQSVPDPAILPGPDGTAYAITADVVPVVIELPRPTGPWDPPWQLVGGLGRGSAQLAWSEGEVRVIEQYDGPTTELRFDGRRWTAVRTAAPERPFMPSRHGIVTSVAGTYCWRELFTGTSTYCPEGGRVITRTVDREVPIFTELHLPEPVRPFSNEVIAQVPPTYWAGAHAVVGEGPDSHVRLPRLEAFSDGLRWLEQVEAGAVTSITMGDGPMLAHAIDGNAAGELFVLDQWYRPLRGTRTRAGVTLTTLTIPGDTGGLGAVGALEATPDGAWAVLDNRVLRIAGERVVVDAELPFTSFEDEVDLVDIDVTGDDVWVLAAIGHRTRTAVLFHRELDERGTPVYRSVQLGFGFWGRGHLERVGETLFLAVDRNGPAEVMVLPIAELGGTMLPRPFEEFVRSDVAPPGFYPPRFENAELWVDARGPWLSSGERTVWLPLE